MDCPECGGPLATYTLSGRDATVCERCGYVGIEADHTGEPVQIESWEKALSRFRGEDQSSAGAGSDS